MRLEFLEKDQTGRTVKERELLQKPAVGASERFPVGHLYLPDYFSSSSAYGKSKQLELQVTVSRRFMPSFFTVSMNPSWKVLSRVELDIHNVLILNPLIDKPSLSDRPDVAARVYN